MSRAFWSVNRALQEALQRAGAADSPGGASVTADERLELAKLYDATVLAARADGFVSAQERRALVGAANLLATGLAGDGVDSAEQRLINQCADQLAALAALADPDDVDAERELLAAVDALLEVAGDAERRVGPEDWGLVNQYYPDGVDQPALVGGRYKCGAASLVMIAATLGLLEEGETMGEAISRVFRLGEGTSRGMSPEGIAAAGAALGLRPVETVPQAASVDWVERQLRAGNVVVAGVNNPDLPGQSSGSGHWVAVVAVRGRGESAEFLVLNPADGSARWATAAQLANAFRNGTLEGRAVAFAPPPGVTIVTTAP